MLLIHEPKGGPKERYDLDALTAIEAEIVERATDKKWPTLEQDLQQQSPTAMRAVLWVWRKRATPTLRYADFDVPNWRKCLKVRLSSEEVADVVAALEEEGLEEDSAEYVQTMRELRILAEDPEDIRRAFEAAAPKAQEQPTPDPAPESLPEYINAEPAGELAASSSGASAS